MKHHLHSLILKALLFLGGISSCPAQSLLPLHIFPGDVGFSTSSVWPSPIMQWGSRFTYMTPVLPPGVYDIVFGFQEIPSGAVTGPNQRVFTISYLGQTSRPLDLWKMAGVEPVQLAGKIYLSFPSPVTITFAASVRNAMVSEISITPQPVPGSSEGILFLSRPEDLTQQPCPVGWAGPTFPDGTCLAIFFSQVQNNPGQPTSDLVQLKRTQ